MNIFGKFSFLLLICLIIQLKCFDEEEKKIYLVKNYYERYNKSEKIEMINNTNNTNGDEDNINNNITYKTTYEISEKLYFGKIKYYNSTTVFRNFPTENSSNFCSINCSNIKKDSTFTKEVNGDFIPWPTDDNNNNIKFISVIDFEFDEKGNIYILDEGDINGPIKLYKFDIELKEKPEVITILSEKTVNVTNFVIDTKKNYVYIAYYSLKDNKNNIEDIELGIIYKDLSDTKGSTKNVTLKDNKIKYDDNYGLPQHFMDNEFNNITKKILSLALSCDSEVLFFCPLSSRKIYSVLTEKIKSVSSLTKGDVNEAYKDDASSSLISSNLGNLYLTGIEENNTIYIAGQVENDLTIFNYKGIETRKSEENRNMFTQTDLSIEDGNLYIISKHIENNKEDTYFTLVTEIYNTSIDREKSYVYKCAGLAYKWDFKSYIIWGIFILVLCFVLVFVFIGNKEDEDINKKNN